MDSITTPSERAFYSASISEFLTSDVDLILGALTRKSGFSIVTNQRDAWIFQIQNLQEQFQP